MKDDDDKFNCFWLMLLSVVALLLIAFHPEECEAAEPEIVETIEEMCDELTEIQLPHSLRILKWDPVTGYSIEIKEAVRGMIHNACLIQTYTDMESPRGVYDEPAKIF